MKPTRIFYSFYRNIKAIKYRFIVIFIIMSLLLISTAISSMHRTPSSIKCSVFDILLHSLGKEGILGILSLTFIIVPTFSFILISIIDFEKSIFYLVRSKSRESIWNKEALFIIILSFIFSIVLVFGGYLASGLIVEGFRNNWSSTDSFTYSLIGRDENWKQISTIFSTYKMMLYILTSNFLGLCTIGFFICTIKKILPNVYVYLLLFIIMLSDGIVGKFSFILNQMTINLRNWMSPNTILISDIYLILLIVIFYIVGREIINKKDFI